MSVVIQRNNKLALVLLAISGFYLMVMVVVEISKAGLWVSVHELTATSMLIKVGALANYWTCVGLSMVTMDTSVEDIAKVRISPVARWLKSAIKWDPLKVSKPLV